MSWISSIFMAMFIMVAIKVNEIERRIIKIEEDNNE